jgi:glycosyltransferase involved in cell wall biosynthesis
MIVSQFDAALAGGSPQARYIENLGLSRDRIFTPYNAVDNHFFAMRAARAREDPRRYHHLPGLESPAPFFLASGRFIARKNFSRLLEAFGAYVRSRPGDNAWRLIILGDGPERQHLLDTARHGPGSEFVTFAGYQQANEVAVYYGLAGAFIHPALADQWGLVVNEAMAAGLPVLVSTGAGAAEDLVRHGVNGLTFDPYSIDAMADAMCQMSRSGADLARMGHKSSELIDGWSPRRFAEGLWQAVCAGASTQDRAMPLIVRAIICASPAVPQALLRWRSVEE